ncbi:MAG: DUF2202 domain-containing protein [Bryobacteraceae bacterium]|nr:DUF2202 domain-containing protein [Bryobacteraceae bacterium]
MTLHSTSTRAAAWILFGIMLAASLPAPAQDVAAATPEEAKWLTFMREEEKLARDVYAALHERWRLRIFDNIARSESRHFAAAGVLLDRYDIADPAKGLPAGVYLDANLASLYQKLLDKGMLSLKDALEVGVMIEKQDIADLEEALKAAEKTDIKTVYANLLAGSLNHLESFENLLEAVVKNE